MLFKDYTLIIPTYNRPKEFGTLLRYLNQQKAKFNILVLDSSCSEVSRENEKILKEVDLNVESFSFSTDTPPFEKFWKGVQKVKTPFCSLCADDDILVVNSIDTIVDFLKENSTYVAAHGLYFSFSVQKETVISDLVYSRDVLSDDNPIIRLGDLFQSYEAITYALYRTSVLEKIFSQLQPLNSLLGRELLGGALTVAMGKVKRLPLFYCGRSLSASHFYESWHPIEMLMTSPDALYAEYGKYREILVDNLQYSSGLYSGEELYKLVDIIHFSYMSEFLAPNILSYLSNQVMKHRELSEIMTGLWPYILKNQKNGSVERPLNKVKTLLKKWNFFNRAPQQVAWLTEFDRMPFQFSEEFKTKIQLYSQNLCFPPGDTLMLSMDNYLNSLKNVNHH